MNTNPTPWQYFLDVLCQKRIQETEAENNPPKLRKVMEYYHDLKETEVVFTTPVYHEKRLKPSASYWTVGYICRGRGYRRDDIAFRALPIEPMLKPKAEIASSDFQQIKKEGLYFNQVSEQYHLLISKGSDILESLKMTGYDFDQSFCEVTHYDYFHSSFQADAFVKVKYPFLEGRVFVTYLTEEVKVEEVAETEPQAEPPVDIVEEQNEVTEPTEEAPVVQKPYQQNFKKKR